MGGSARIRRQGGIRCRDALVSRRERPSVYTGQYWMGAAGEASWAAGQFERVRNRAPLTAQSAPRMIAPMAAIVARLDTSSMARMAIPEPYKMESTMRMRFASCGLMGLS